MQRISPYFCEFVTVDTRSDAIKYYKDFSATNGPLDDSAFKKALRQIQGRFDSPVLVTETIVSHYGYVNNNWRYYTPEFGKYNATTLIKPIPKPVLLNHDRYEDAIGRVLISRYEDILGLSDKQRTDLKTRTGFVKAFSYISGQENIEKVMDERYLTVSIGGRSPEVKCSICQTNLIQDDCEHRLGESYEKKLCYLVYGAQEYAEYSYVNAPADKQARTQRFQMAAPQDCLVSDYAELVKATMSTANQTPLEVFDEDRYLAYMTDAKHQELFSFTDAKMVSGSDVFGSLAPIADSVERGDGGDGELTPPPKTKNQNTSQEANEVEIKEATLEDLLKLGIMKDYIANIRKSDTEKITELTGTITTKDSEIEQHKADLKSKDDVVSAKDEEIKTLKADLTKYSDAEKSQNADTLVDLMIKLEKPAVKTILDEKDEAKKAEAKKEVIKKINERSDDSVKDSIADLQVELAAKQSDGDSSLSEGVEDDVTTNDNRSGGTEDKDGNPLAAVIDKKEKANKE